MDRIYPILGVLEPHLTPLGPTSVGEALRLLRRRARLSRDELAGRARISAGAVSNYENDVSAPPAASLRRVVSVLAEALDIDRAELWEQFGQLCDAADLVVR
jgi:transcriptional regulator with XRE-family HTH domain